MCADLTYFNLQGLYVKFCVSSMAFYKIAAWGHLVPHEHTENPVCFCRAFDSYLFQSPCVGIHCCVPKLICIHFTQTFVPLYPNGFVLAATNFLNKCFTLLLVPGIGLLFSFLYKIKGGLCYIDIALFHQLLHIAIDESKYQRGNMTAVYVGIGHDNELMITKLIQIQGLWIFWCPNSHSERSEHISDFFVFIYLMFHRLLYIQNFSAQRQDSLEASITTLFGSTPPVSYTHLTLPTSDLV